MRRLSIMVLMLAAACSEPTESILPSVTGQWTGTVPPAGASGSVPATASITQSGNALTGSVGLDGSPALPLTGTISLNGELTFSFREEGSDPPRFIFFVGDLTLPTRMDGELHNWYDLPVPMSFTKR
jgi:hypothetical protein